MEEEKEEEEAFPNDDELEVASALLLLSNTHSPSPKVKSISEISQIAALSYTTPVSDSKSKSADSSIVTVDDDDIHSASPKMKSISETSHIVALSYTALVSDSKFKSTDSSTVTADNDDTHSVSPKVKSISETSQIAALSYATSVSDSKSKSTDSSTVTADEEEEEHDDYDDYDDDGSFAEAKANARQMKMIRMIRVINKLKAVQRRRSKSLCISDCLKINSGKPKTAISLTTSCTSASSCLSIDSAAAGDISSRSRGGSCEATRVVLKERECVPRKMKVIFSAHMRRRAEAILKVLSSHGCASEVRIRELLGDSPDTSKALRILLRLEEVKRTGAGGRTDPYVYVIS